MTNKMLVSLLACATLAGSAVAGGLPQAKCGGAKQKTVGKTESGLLACYSKGALKPPSPVDPLCTGKVEGKFAPAFVKADLKGACVGDPAVVDPEVDSCVQHVVVTIPVATGHEKCAAAKMKAAGKSAAGKVLCYSKSTGKGALCSISTKTPCLTDADCPSGETCNPVLPVDPACLQKAADGLTTAVTKADTTDPSCAGAATAAADALAIATAIDSNCVTTIVNGLPGKAPGCGNGVLEPALGETCDDGNLKDGDGCPHDCVVASCSPVSGATNASVNYTPPAGGPTIAGLTVFVDYPEGKVNGLTVSHPIGVSGSPNDVGYGVTDAVVKLSGLPTKIMSLSFANLCQGAPAPSAADFGCTVTDASDTGGNPVDPSTITCSVSIP